MGCEDGGQVAMSTFMETPLSGNRAPYFLDARQVGSVGTRFPDQDGFAWAYQVRSTNGILVDDKYDPPRPFTVEVAPSIAGNGFTDPSLVQGHVGDWETASICKVLEGKIMSGQLSFTSLHYISDNLTGGQLR